MKKEFKTLQEIADYLGISRMQLYRWGKINPLPRFYLGYGRRDYDVDLWTPEDADKWMHKTREKGRWLGGRCAYKM